MRNLKKLMGLALAGMLVACGGGGGSGGTPGSGSGSGGDGGAGSPEAPSAVANFYVYADKTTINNSGADTATVKVVTVDANNNVVANAAVAVSTDQNSVFTPTAGAVTDAAGTYSGSVSNGADKSDRDITVSVTVNGIQKQTSLRVSGSKLTLQADPANPLPGQSVNLTATLLDSSGNPIAGAPINLSGTVPELQGQVLTTSAAGVATKTFVAPAAVGVYAVSASGSGVNSPDYQIQVFPVAGAVPVAVIPSGSAPSLSASPNVLSTNTPGSTTNRSTLRLLFLDNTNSPVPNVRVRFDDMTTGVPRVGASLSTGTQTSYTDSSGVVTSQYIPGPNSSPTNGVSVRACYSATDFSSTTDCPASVSMSLTVAGHALAVSIGNDNLLTKGSGTYIKTFTVTVADSAGRAVAGAPIDISVDLTHYGKGAYGDPYRNAAGVAISNLSAIPAALTDSYPSDSANPAMRSERVWCANEDTNRNGSVDPGENRNGSTDSTNQPTLEPRKSDLLIRYADPSVTTTNASGILLVTVEYSQRMATWLTYRIRATANVAGSQGLAERLFVTTFVEGDETNGSFLLPPYGSDSCLSPS